jgi:hypothetical protein
LVESEDVATNSRSRCEEQHIPFFRFSPNLDSEVDSGETKDEVLIDMLITTKFQAVELWSDLMDDLLLIFARVEEFSQQEGLLRLKEKKQRNAFRARKISMISNKY